MKTIQPLLETDSSEVLINLMTRHIRRFIELKEKAESFEDLFGSASVREEAAKRQGLDREDFLVKSYMLNVKRAGRFKFVSSALVLQPTADATHFHLIYATRSVKGIEVFKNAERRAMNAMETVRTGKRLEKDPEPQLFQADELGASAKFRDMRARYNEKSRAGSLALIEKRGEVPYDELFGYALAVPLTFEADLKTWLKQWAKEGRIAVIGRGVASATPKIMEGVSVKWVRR